MAALARQADINYLSIGVSEVHNLSACSECGKQVESIIGCPDGVEVCQQCFDAGRH